MLSERSFLFTSPSRWLLILLLVAGRLSAASNSEDVRGLPFIRAYSLDEIGKVPRSTRIGFDSFGRFATMYDGFYAVLNDTAWMDRTDPSPANRTVMNTIQFVNGTYYYGGRASWGIAEQTPEGNLRARSLVPPDAPAWTTLTPFNQILATRSGVYFFEFNGVVYWDFSKQKNFFFQLPRMSTCFRVADRVFVSCQDRILHEILPATGTIEVVSVPGLSEAVVERSASLDDTRTLLSLQDGRLLAFDGNRAISWPPQGRYGLSGRVLALTPLAEGGIALSIANQGIFIFSSDGNLQWRLPLAEFKLVGALAANEPGVLWAVGENGIFKVFYDSPLTSFGQLLGQTVLWPRIVSWNGRLVVGSAATVLESEAMYPEAPPRFKPLAGMPDVRVTTLAAQGLRLLVADALGVFAARADGAFERIMQLQNVARIEFVGPDVCVVIGSREIAALRHADGRWTECAPRIAGVGDVSIHTTVCGAVWIEMGGDSVARLTLRDGVLAMERIALPWSGGQWTNVGAVGPHIILSGSPGHRAFYDERSGALCEAPQLEALLRNSPYWISRVTEDDTGRLWATHARGVVTFTPEKNGYAMDATTFELSNDSYPSIRILRGHSLWLESSRSLYRVENQATPGLVRPHLTLVSIVGGHQNQELLNATKHSTSPAKFAFDDNSLSFRFFSGTYAWRSPPQYQYRLAASESWTRVDSSMVLRFPKLRDGTYLLEVRQDGPQNPGTAPFTFAFVVNPPWYRTPLSFGAYAALLLLSLIGIARWMNQRSLKRNAELEKLVQERTRKLDETMVRLNEETRNAATYAERSRLAGEIHDSLQQGLVGTMLHLETTMSHPSLLPEVQAQLSMIKKMLSYSREEVKQAVWNLESPLLRDSTLDVALHKLAEYFKAGSAVINVVTPQDPVVLEPGAQHNLLRIAQEAITNSLRHAQAGHIGVTLQVQAGKVTLNVSDDGRGFDPAASSQFEGHFGLRGIRGRALSINAQLQIISTLGTGTTVQVIIPQLSSVV